MPVKRVVNFSLILWAVLFNCSVLCAQEENVQGAPQPAASSPVETSVTETASADEPVSPAPVVQPAIEPVSSAPGVVPVPQDKQSAEVQQTQVQQNTPPPAPAVQAPAVVSVPEAPASTAVPASAAAAAVAASLASPQSSAKVQKKEPAPERKQTQQIRYIKSDGKRFVLLRDMADYYDLTLLETKSSVILYSKTHRIEFIRNRREGAIDGVKTFFLSPLVVYKNNFYLYEEDFLRVIDPILRNKVLAKQRIRTIMLDPGHGGQDAGAKGPVFPEKQINLILALKLRKALELMGFTVLMTRDNDTFPTLENRANMCRSQAPDLYISIHCNSTTTRSVVGIETYAMTPAGGTSTADVRGQDRTYANNKWDRNNYRLAYEVQKSLLKFTKKEDRGVRHARFYVLRYATCPAILVECGFLSNIEEGKELASSTRQNRIVAAILSGIAHYYTASR